MFMLTSSVVVELQEVIKKQREEIKDLQVEMRQIKREYELKNQEAIAELRKEMSKSLVESDLKRNEATAKLEIYEKLDTKADANVIKDMLGRLIDSMGKGQSINIVK